MTAEEVRGSLLIRWPDTEYLSISEAPQDSSRQGRKIDLLVISLWPSRGLKRQGVEIKVSMSDWRRELKEAAKADWWWRHVHFFWVAVPEKMAEQVALELPAGWGLLSCAEGKKPKTVVKAEHHDPEPLPWPATVGVMRAAADAGVNALYRAEQRGREEGRKRGLEEAERRSPDGYAKAQLDQLREQVKGFEEASGMTITGTWRQPKVLGTYARLLATELRDPGFLLSGAEHAANGIEEAAKRATKSAADARKFAARIKQLGDAARNGDESHADGKLS